MNYMYIYNTLRIREHKRSWWNRTSQGASKSSLCTTHNYAPYPTYVVCLKETMCCMQTSSLNLHVYHHFLSYIFHTRLGLYAFFCWLALPNVFNIFFILFYANVTAQQMYCCGAVARSPLKASSRTPSIGLTYHILASWATNCISSKFKEKVAFHVLDWKPWAKTE